MIQVRILTKSDCPKCKSFVNRLTKQNFQFLTLEESDQNTLLFDEWGVDEFPVIQILSNSEVVATMPHGTYSAFAIRAFAEKKGFKLT